MNIRDISKKTGLSVTALEYAAGVLGIPISGRIEKSDCERIWGFLKHNGGYAPDALKRLETIDLTDRPVRHKVKFLGGGEGFKGDFLLRRQGFNKIHVERQTRNCGDTAAMVLEAIKSDNPAVATVGGISREDFLVALRATPTAHVLWQATIHQHTFSLERCPLKGNRIIQSYQCGKGTYNVQYWCGMNDTFTNGDAAEVCGPLRNVWFAPSDSKLAELADLLTAFYTAETNDRASIWQDLPFHPSDTGALLQTNELAFACDKTVLTGATFPAALTALSQKLGVKC